MRFRYLFLSFILLAACSKIPTVDPEGVLVVIPYPSPTSSSLNIHVQNTELSAYLIQIFDPKANIVLEENVSAGDSKHSFSVDLSSSPKGSYVVVLKKNAVVYTKKFLKV
ncbi:T9SS type A sorting domain-containing protein [Dyadobacter sp. CY312]|uniref:T9SS type A sorting domain-containing protein n=1 Tax=Dyadobacter sp. CY312 TaxID=2907303 RepID=UPI001F47C1A5|nr:T9SS type A sorting domain-containing protein [Dyadobacter sp. CY312]MCE7044321.1 T9SS type A sorting domain-containing protein [Dyadobacter sp. CY312]